MLAQSQVDPPRAMVPVSQLSLSTNQPPYPRAVPEKFDPEGNEQYYPGNTIVCHVPAASPLVSALQAPYDALKNHPTLGAVSRLLPPSSWHMTIFDGARLSECEPGMWPEGLKKLPLDEYEANFTRDLKAFGDELENEGLAGPYRMKVTGFGDMVVGFGLALEGVTVEEEQRVRRLRDRLGDILGFKAPNHLTYQWHITVAYWVRHMQGPLNEDLDNVLTELMPAVCIEVELGPLEFCTFEGMCHFERQFYIASAQQQLQ